MATSKSKSSRKSRVAELLRRYIAALKDPKRSRTRRAFYVLGGGVGLIVMGGIALLLYAVLLYPFTPSRASLEQMKVQRPTVLFSADGKEIARYRHLNSEWVALEDISLHVVQALVATEDHRFYAHSGVDWKRMGSSIVHTFTGDPQGASTLPMQLARNLYPKKIGNAFLPNRKLKEVITARKIEKVYTKEEILEAYLNTVPFLYNVFGIEMGARTYFDKSAKQLNVLESATLVGMLKATTYYNPARNPERSQWRRNVVLGQMMKHGHLSAERFAALKTQPTKLKFERQSFRRSLAPHFTEQVRRQLDEWADDNGYNLFTDGLRVYTTLDTRLQKLAQQGVDRQMKALQAVADTEWGQQANPRRGSHPEDYFRYRPKKPFAYFWATKTDLVNDFIQDTPRYRQMRGTADERIEALRANTAFMDSLRTAKTRLETGFMAMDPRTGHVKAWVGSRNYFAGQYDHVVHARRQPGSTFKPFVYAAALESGFTPEDTFEDGPVEIRVSRSEVWRPVNAGSYTEQPMTLREGLARSKNTISAQLIHEIGAGKTADYARRMGVKNSKLDEVPSLALGTSSVTLLEMVTAYGTVASGGIYHEPLLVTRIEDAAGNELARFTPDEYRALEERTALAVFDMLRDGVKYGTSQRINTVFGIRSDVAGKTGTTQDNADGWFLLMHPQLVGGAWVGFNDPRVTFRSDYWGQGAHNALYVVGDVYRAALRQGHLNPNLRLPEPPSFHRRDNAFDRVGEWFADVFDRARDAIEDNIDRVERAPDEQQDRLRRDQDRIRQQQERIQRERERIARLGEQARREAVRRLAEAERRRDTRRAGSDHSHPHSDDDARANRSRRPEAGRGEAPYRPPGWRESEAERQQRMERYWEEIQQARREREARFERYLQERHEANRRNGNVRDDDRSGG